MEPLVAYLHYLAIVLIAGFLVAEIAVCRPSLDAQQVRLLPRLDVVFFGGALLALATGLLRLFYYAKGVGFYLPNPFFLMKMALVPDDRDPLDQAHDLVPPLASAPGAIRCAAACGRDRGRPPTDPSGGRAA